MKRLVSFPHIAVVFTAYNDHASDMVSWCEANAKGRWYEPMGGDHEFQFDEVLDDGSDQDTTYAHYFVFREASDLMLFKLTWGGA
ncbi:hypothetical protein U5A82_06205 [Sphingobium sp. CR2-8]|uniref:hypothetical protein n=1 Tax=Sphingobium sp. CR2-8 TaxID=1306534 RepID=UPI002DB65F25|nr:hypothetical protein [Sphingobium sp. CR2-8]MEC3910081.1 hypothetical protein [Sphingobium sp. CR2-8]